ncbi:hypothetical protein L198_03042 [Cryptococcus wingfieldii CBS 7118]|uniref:Cytochrome c oxidase assembly factor 3 n=1 Tax=Cryptococcus wingfieldii CBS 7118 TaxID=1295528 RepID=A0A1E3JJA3_9TREE|nr:hypothetical protein L198_03042 [Cryptococcus wingfieldii CBS 7118]ODO00716.1 hypothetical protein L198_03042 [Cryptococcus wingfieldii CBS 7118]
MPPKQPEPLPMDSGRPDRRQQGPAPPRRAPLPPRPSSSATRPLGAGPIPEHVKARTLWQSYQSLTPKARIGFGVVVGFVGIGGMVWDQQVLQDEPAKEQKPLINMRMVDRPAK